MVRHTFPMSVSTLFSTHYSWVLPNGQTDRLTDVIWTHGRADKKPANLAKETRQVCKQLDLGKRERTAAASSIFIREMRERKKISNAQKRSLASRKRLKPQPVTQTGLNDVAKKSHASHCSKHEVSSLPPKDIKWLGWLRKNAAANIHLSFPSPRGRGGGGTKPISSRRTSTSTT